MPFGMRISWPTCAFGSKAIAWPSVNSFSGSCTSSTTRFTTKMWILSVFGSTSATRSSLVRNCLRAATSMASFTALITICGSMPFSLLRISMDSNIDATLVASFLSALTVVEGYHSNFRFARLMLDSGM